MKNRDKSGICPSGNCPNATAGKIPSAGAAVRHRDDGGTIKDAGGGIIAVLPDETLDMKLLPAGPIEAVPTVEHQSRFRAGFVVSVMKPGTYDLYLSVGQRDGTPVYELPCNESGGQKRYKIGRIELTE